MDEALNISLYFDQYSRYRIVAEAVEALSAPGDTVLDVGSGQGCVLGSFLRNRDVFYLDPMLQTRAAVSGDPHYIASCLEEIGACGQCFDVIVAVDTLEHVAPERRQGFVERLSAMAGKGLVLAMPCRDAGCAEEVDREVNAVYRQYAGMDYPWLGEHFECGLPSLAEITRQLRNLGWKVNCVGNGHGPWLQELLPWVAVFIDEPSGRRVMEELSRDYNRRLCRYDHLSPCYRQVVIAQRSCRLELPTCGVDDAACRERAARVWEDFRGKMVARIGGEFIAALRRAEETEDLASLRQQVNVLRDRLDEMRSSKLWRITAPLRATAYCIRWTRRRASHLLAGAVERGGRFAYRHLPLSDRGRWALTKFYFRLFGRLLRRTGAYHAYRQELQWRQSAMGPDAIENPDRLPRPDSARPDCLFWGVIDWHFRHQRPQHLAAGLAAHGHRVFYISPRFADNPRRPFVLERLDVEGEVYQARLSVSSPVPIYQGEPQGAQAQATRGALRELLRRGNIQRAVCVVQHPGWRQLAYMVPDSQIVYDCMDHHRGFGQAAECLGPVERDLVARSEIVVASSSWLYDRLRVRNPRTVLVRNACDPEHFRTPPQVIHKDRKNRRTIGYYGAIAEWFDAELLYQVARTFCDCRILLVGADTAGVVKSLGSCKNVESHGEVPYDELPCYLHAMDVCLIPFQLVELTHATNPLKVYEYLAAGKPVVTTDLPELRHPEMQPLLYRARNRSEFIEGVRAALAEAPDAPIRTKRRQFAACQSWRHRVETLEQSIDAISDPPVSVIIVTWNNLDLTRKCIDSIFEVEDYDNLELVIVDNASGDGTTEYLEQLRAGRSNVNVIINDENRGFAPANNQGMEAATGEYLVLLNNDTAVTPGWLRTLVGHLRRKPDIGILGPVTNNIGNEACVATSYANREELINEARMRAQAHAGKVFDIAVTPFFCAAFSREVYNRVGPLDEDYELGFFEDDDYCQRIRQQGLRVCCAEDVLIHHELSASFDRLSAERREEIFARNRAYYESKWGRWTPHNYRRAVQPETA